MRGGEVGGANMMRTRDAKGMRRGCEHGMRTWDAKGMRTWDANKDAKMMRIVSYRSEELSTLLY